MFKKNNNFTQRMIIMGLLIALEIILTRFLSIQLPIVRIGLGFLPVAICAMMYGPIWSGVCYAIGDVLGMMLFPSPQGYFPGFTLSAFVTGVIFGIFLYNKEVKFVNAFLASFVSLLIVTVFMNTLWLNMLVGKAFLVLLPPRLLEAAFMLVVEIIMIIGSYKVVIQLKNNAYSK
ncbi:MAG: folate family ECF transporter S component [Eubacteriales bacterium]|nr:folate family ECF transporter S component [Eubacteriales bacterium]MDY3332914.1 folate family ECF transporter S component [Gallibacter sp.]